MKEIEAVGGRYVLGPRMCQASSLVFEVSPRTRVATKLARGRALPSRIGPLSATWLPVSGMPRLGEFRDEVMGRVRAAGLPDVVVDVDTGLADTGVQAVANLAAGRVNAAIGAGTANSPAWWVYTLPKVVAGLPVLVIGAAADKVSKDEVLEVLPEAKSGISYVVDMLEPAAGMSGLGQAGGIASIIAPIAAAVIGTAGALGGVLISTQAQKYVIKQQTKSDLQIALAQQNSDLKALEFQLAAQRVMQEQETLRTTERAGTTKAIAISYAPYVGLGLIGIAAVMLATRR